MKLSLRRIIEIIVTVLIIFALFHPYIYNITPYDYAFTGSLSLMGVLCVTLPLSLLVLFLILLVFQGILKNPLLKILKVVSFLLYAITFGSYAYLLYEATGFGIQEYAITLIAGALLLLPSLIFNKHLTDNLLNTILATIAMPFVFHLLAYDHIGLHKGGMIIQGAFVVLYAIGFSKVFKQSN